MTFIFPRTFGLGLPCRLGLDGFCRLGLGLAVLCRLGLGAPCRSGLGLSGPDPLEVCCTYCKLKKIRGGSFVLAETRWRRKEQDWIISFFTAVEDRIRKDNCPHVYCLLLQCIIGAVTSCGSKYVKSPLLPSLFSSLHHPLCLLRHRPW